MCCMQIFVSIVFFFLLSNFQNTAIVQKFSCHGREMNPVATVSPDIFSGFDVGRKQGEKMSKNIYVAFRNFLE